MSPYDFTDFSRRPESLITLCEYRNISPLNMDEIREIISYLQIPSSRVEEGDDLTIDIIDNRIEGIKGFLAVWRNKAIACINTGKESVWGRWSDEDRLLLTGDFATAEDGETDRITGRIAYNDHGVRGIYSKGVFFRLLDQVLIMDVNYNSSHGDNCGRAI